MSAASAFTFMGKLGASKSILNRGLLVKSYFPDLDVAGESDADDVRLMLMATASLANRHEIPVGSAGTVLRFMALRAAREPGKHVLRGHPRLFERPQQELLKILKQVGVEGTLGPDSLTVEGNGWKLQGDTLMVSSDKSSQFATSVLLNAWNLPFDLYVSLSGRRASEGYWRMSLKLAELLGMKLDFWDNDFRVPRAQKPSVTHFPTEIDMSSAFTVAALAAVNGQATLLDFPRESLQPDAMFVEILNRMGVPIRREANTLKVARAARLNGVAVNLSQAPDLFPVLASLCVLAHGESDLYGAPQLVYKESDRLHRISEVLKNFGREIIVKPDGLRILGAEPGKLSEPLRLDTDHDHRLAFAFAVWRQAGLPVEIANSKVISKSFPELWNILGWNS